MTNNSVGDEGRKVVDAIRCALVSDFGPVTELMAESNPFHLYTAVALSAAMVNWASHETGRTVDELLNELAANYRQ